VDFGSLESLRFNNSNKSFDTEAHERPFDKKTHDRPFGKMAHDKPFDKKAHGKQNSLNL